LPGAVFARSWHDLAEVVGKAAADAITAPTDTRALDTALAWLLEPGNHLLTLADATYPPSLLEIADPPPVLYVKGDPALLQRPALAMVGARSATPQGIANAEAFARALSEAGFTIVSGLALGIDAASHRGALAAHRDAQTGSTIAVIGTGADRIYPASNATLAREIAARGAIVSEFPLTTPPKRQNFPRRNRLIAGLTRGVLVVEAALGSGSLITARLAADSGREVFAIPGSIHSPLARGCHHLIRQGAKLVETAEDILEEIATAQERSTPRTTPRTPPSSRHTEAPRKAPQQSPLPLPALSPDATRVLEALGDETGDIDTLATTTGLTIDALYAILLPLELEGIVARLAGGRFQRVRVT
jgi:DNA processing protein